MRKVALLLGVAVGPALVAFCYALLSGGHSEAYNGFQNEYRRWPWRAGAEHTITTLPGQEEHKAPIWVQHDIDVGGSFKVHSSSSRGVVRMKEFVPDDNGDGISGGWTLDIQEEDGLQYHVYYLHLEQPGGLDNVYAGAEIYQGQWVAISSNSGCSSCGTHLHFGMSTQAYGGDNIPIFPLAGFQSESDFVALGKQSYTSDNAGIGDACGPPCYESTDIDGTFYSAFTQVYNFFGGHNGPGVTWDPWDFRLNWWVHYWTTSLPHYFTGVAQNFISPNSAYGQSAIMQGYGLGTFWVYGDFWLAYTATRPGTGNWYIAYIGYPTGVEGNLQCTYNLRWFQSFQNGAIRTWCTDFTDGEGHFHQADHVEVYIADEDVYYAQSAPIPTPTPVPTRTPTRTPTPTPTFTPTPTIDPTLDTDGDGVPDYIDNCPTTPNPDQLNSDGQRRQTGIQHDGSGVTIDDTSLTDTNMNWQAPPDNWAGQWVIIGNVEMQVASDYTATTLTGVIPAGHTTPWRYVFNVNLEAPTPPNGSAYTIGTIQSGVASNPIQDAVGDACDDDNDNDGLPDSEESDAYCPYRLVFDSDGDHVGDGYDVGPCDFATSSCSDATDVDEDGIVACIERKYNTCTESGDQVGQYSTCDDPVDSDGDGCPDWLEMNDVNGDRSVNTLDVLVVAKRAADLIPSNPISDAVLDVNHDGSINSIDTMFVARNQCSVRGLGPFTCAPE